MFRGERAKAVLIRGLEVVVIATFVALLWDNYRLRTTRQIRASSASGAFSVGEPLSRVPITDGSGVEREFSFMSGRTVVVVLNPSCPTCARTLNELRERSADVLVLGHATARDLPAVAARYGFERRAFTISKSAAGSFGDRFTVSPQIFVVEKGRVVRTCHSAQECNGV